MSERDSNCAVEYRPIPNFPGYMIGSDGSVWSCKRRGRPLGEKRTIDGQVFARIRPQLNARGYGTISRQKNKKQIVMFVAHAVLFAFVGPRPEGLECCHGDGDKLNNALSNLRWDTRQSNHMDKLWHDSIPIGEKASRAKLTYKDVQEIKRLFEAGIKQTELGKMFGVNQTSISAIVNGHRWENVGSRTRLTVDRLPPEDRIKWIRTHYGRKDTQAASDIFWLLDYFGGSSQQEQRNG